jgi:hypothetical protein
LSITIIVIIIIIIIMNYSTRRPHDDDDSIDSSRMSTNEAEEVEDEEDKNVDHSELETMIETKPGTVRDLESGTRGTVSSSLPPVVWNASSASSASSSAAAALWEQEPLVVVSSSSSASAYYVPTQPPPFQFQFQFQASLKAYIQAELAAERAILKAELQAERATIEQASIQRYLQTELQAQRAILKAELLQELGRSDNHNDDYDNDATRQQQQQQQQQPLLLVMEKSPFPIMDPDVMIDCDDDDDDDKDDMAENDRVGGGGGGGGRGGRRSSTFDDNHIPSARTSGRTRRRHEIMEYIRRARNSMVQSISGGGGGGGPSSSTPKTTGSLGSNPKGSFSSQQQQPPLPPPPPVPVLEIAQQTLPPDSYSLLVCSEPLSWPFFLGGMVALNEALMFGMLASNQYSGDPHNPLELPADVEPAVRFTQVMAIFISVLVQDDLRVSVERTQESYLSLEPFQGLATPAKWVLANVLRAMLGAAGLFVAFLLIIQSQDVFNLLLNFTGVAFVSELDEISFLLAIRGFFGDASRLKAQEIVKTEYPIHSQNDATTHAVGSFFSGRAFKLGLVATIMYGGFVVVVTKQHIKKEFMCETINVVFGDTSNPLLGTYSGNYRLDRKTRHKFRNDYYELRGEDAEDVSKSTVKKGVFAYCGMDSKWTFSAKISGDRESLDPCEGYMASSPTTQTFDITDFSSSSDGWLLESKSPLEFFRVSCLDWESSSSVVTHSAECHDSPMPSTLSLSASSSSSSAAAASSCGDYCPKLSIFGTAGFDNGGGIGAKIWSKNFERLSFPSLNAYDHPIFWGNDSATDTGAIDLVLFTGRRWVLLDSNVLQALHNTTYSNENIKTITIADTISDVFADGRFHASLLQGKGVISFLSDPVNPAVTSLAPIGLNWHRALYESENNLAAQGDNDLVGTFPGVDPSRPSEAVLSCTVCNDVTNPCEFEGICHSDGTCTCANNAQGVLCQIAPKGDGHCDPYFNTPSFEYDGGDCCGATCEGLGCFELIYNDDDNIALVGNATVTAYPHCIDPMLVTITIYIHGEMNAIVNTIQCDGKRYSFYGQLYAEEIVQVKDGANCELVFENIHTWNDPYIEIRYNFTSDLEYKMFGRPVLPPNDGSDTIRIPFTVISRCLLMGIKDVVDDLNVFGNVSSPEAQAIGFLEAAESDSSGSVCGPFLKQQYAAAVLSFAGWFKPARNCEWSIVTCNNQGIIQEIGKFNYLTGTSFDPFCTGWRPFEIHPSSICCHGFVSLASIYIFRTIFRH